MARTRMQRFGNRVTHLFNENADIPENREAIGDVEFALNKVVSAPSKEEAKDLAAEVAEIDLSILATHPAYDSVLDELFSDEAEELVAFADLKKGAKKAADAERHDRPVATQDWEGHVLEAELWEIFRALKSHYKALCRGESGSALKMKRAERLYKKLQANFKGLIDARRMAVYDVVSEWDELMTDEDERLARQRRRSSRVARQERTAKGNRKRLAGADTTKSSAEEVAAFFSDLIDAAGGEKELMKKVRAMGGSRIFDEADAA